MYIDVYSNTILQQFSVKDFSARDTIFLIPKKIFQDDE